MANSVIKQFVASTALLMIINGAYAVDPATLGAANTNNAPMPNNAPPTNNYIPATSGYSSSPYMGSNSTTSLFQSFDDQVAIGVSLNSGSLYGATYNNYGLSLDASKLFDNGLWLNVGGNEATANSLTGGSDNYIDGAIGYAMPLGSTVEFIPNFQVQRTQLTVANSGNYGQVATVKDGVVNFRFEWATTNSVNLFATAGFGLAQYNMSNFNNDSSYNNTGALFQTQEGFNYRPLANTPWLINLSYVYRSFNQENIGPINGIDLSTGIGF